MALEAALEHATEFDISGLDKIDARLEPCGHTLRVHRERIGETQPCARCEIATGRLTMATIAHDGPVPEPRRGYTPPRRLGFVTEFHVSESIRRPQPKQRTDTRTYTERHEQALREHAAREARKQERVRAALAHLKHVVETSDTNVVTRLMYDQARGEHMSSERLVKNTGRKWTELLTEAGGVVARRNGRNAEETDEAWVASQDAAHMITAMLGRRPTKADWARHRPRGTLSYQAISRSERCGVFGDWLTSIGLPPPPPVERVRARSRDRSAEIARRAEARKARRAEADRSAYEATVTAVKQWAAEHGKAPSTRAWRVGKPRGAWREERIVAHTGLSWKEWVLSLGLVPGDARRRFDLAAHVGEMRRLAGVFGYTLGADKWNAHRDRAFLSANNLMRNAGCARWAEWVALCGLPSPPAGGAAQAASANVDANRLRRLVEAEAERRGVSLYALCCEVGGSRSRASAVWNRWNAWAKPGATARRSALDDLVALGIDHGMAA